MTQVLFYHLENRSVEQVLPGLLEICLERGWRCVVQTGRAERVKELNEHLWVWRESSFLPHGTADDGNAELQPIWLTDSDDTPNGANVRFLIDGADLAQAQGLDRAVFVFNGNNEDERSQARKAWKAASDVGLEVTYWRQSPQGKWEKQA